MTKYLPFVALLVSLTHVSTSCQPQVLQSGADPNATVRAHRDFVKEMMRQSWDSYVMYAWGWNELKPLTHKGSSQHIFGGDTRMGASIFEALDTLYIMNMTEEFHSGREWVANNFNIGAVNGSLSVFETVIRFVGSLLASYALTDDQMFLEKARHVADYMMPAFNTTTGIPLTFVNPMTGEAHNWRPDAPSNLGESGTLHLEFVYLSYATGDPKYREKVMKIREFLDQKKKPYNGLYINFINPYTGEWGEDHVSVGAGGDSFYEYLIKSSVMSNNTDLMARRMYDSAVEAIERSLVQISRPSQLTYLANMDFGKLDHVMGHLTCFAGGMFALGAKTQDNDHKRQHYMDLAANITETCAQTYQRTDTGIGPELFHFTERYEAVAISKEELYYILRPEVIESYFYLWRLTHDQRFRDYAWSAAQAIGQHCRTDSGFSGISNVNDTHTPKDDVQQAYFMAETLKYLYLIFSTDDLISLDDWVFNTEAHPFPILPAHTS